MRSLAITLTAVCLVLSASLCIARQNAKEEVEPTAISMPGDRAADSYRIYSSLIPVGETAGSAWPHKLWLLKDTTISVIAPTEPCSPASPVDQAARFNAPFSMNPHNAVHPPNDRHQDYLEILEDFDLHCHERLLLEPSMFELSVPVHLLNKGQQEEFVSSIGKKLATAKKYEGAPALYAFSEVYFNRAHSVALVYATQYCGNLCGESFWAAFALEDGTWKELHWNSIVVMS